MNKKRGLLILIVSILLFSAFLGLFYSHSNEKAQMKSDLENYLFNVKNYSGSDIEKIYINHHWFKTGEYHGIVIFKDEPSIKYIYAYNQNNEIYQLGKPKGGKHTEPLNPRNS